MSWATLKLAWAAADAAELDIHTRTVLFDLAKLADNQGSSYPSHTHLARHPALAERRVRIALQTLKDLRFISTIERWCPVSGRQKSNLYTVHAEVLKSVVPSAPRAGGRVHHVPGEGIGRADGPPAPHTPLTSFDTEKGFDGGGAAEDFCGREVNSSSAAAKTEAVQSDAPDLVLIQGGRAA